MFRDANDATIPAGGNWKELGVDEEEEKRRRSRNSDGRGAETETRLSPIRIRGNTNRGAK